MKSQSLITISEPYSGVSESYKMFRTNLNYMNIDCENKVLLFTSTTAEEGKATSLANTAISFAQTGKKVLLIDSDLRKSRIHDIFHLDQGPGLTDILGGKKSLQEVVQMTNMVSHLDILTSGTIPPHPSELLASHVFENTIKAARDQYDIILVNAPPVLSVSDAAIISKVADGVILIVAKKATKRESVRLAKDALQKVGANILGVLMTQSAAKSNRSYYHYETDKKKSSHKKVSVI